MKESEKPQMISQANRCIFLPFGYPARKFDSIHYTIPDARSETPVPAPNAPTFPLCECSQASKCPCINNCWLFELNCFLHHDFRIIPVNQAVLQHTSFL